MLVVIEIKGTGRDAIPADRVTRNLRRHLRQLQADLDTAIEDMEAGQWEGIISAMLYPPAPPAPRRWRRLRRSRAIVVPERYWLARWPGWVRSRSERNGVLPPRTWLANERKLVRSHICVSVIAQTAASSLPLRDRRKCRGFRRCRGRRWEIGLEALGVQLGHVPVGRGSFDEAVPATGGRQSQHRRGRRIFHGQRGELRQVR